MERYNQNTSVRPHLQWDHKRKHSLRVRIKETLLWELGEAKPDTDNIIQLSRMFAVSIDYLLLDDIDIDQRSEHPRIPANPDEINPQAPNIPASVHIHIQAAKRTLRRIIGGMFLGVGLLGIILLAIFAGLQTALLIGIPLLVCGAICVTIKRHLALWLGWALFGMIYIFTAAMTGSGLQWIFRALRGGKTTFSILAYGLILAAVVLTAATVYAIYKRKQASAKG